MDTGDDPFVFFAVWPGDAGHDYASIESVGFAKLAVTGAADMISVYVRQSLIQLATPDGMRGRVSSVSFIFISASNELGEFESGVAARFLGPVGAVLLGGVVAVAIFALQIAVSTWWLGRFRFGPAEWLWRSLSYRRRQPLRRGRA